MDKTPVFVIKYNSVAECHSEDSHIVIPAEIKGINAGAFRGNTTVSEITLGKDVKKVEIHAFYECTSLQSIYVDPENEYFYSVDGILYEKQKNKIILVACPQGRCGKCVIPDGVTHIKEYAFFYCTHITEIQIPDSVTTIGSLAFQGCDKLESLYSLGFTDKYASSKIRVRLSYEQSIIPSTFPQIPFYNHFNKVWKISLILGFLSHPELYSEKQLNPNPRRYDDTYAHYALAQKRHVLPYVFQRDDTKMLQFYVDQGAITAKNFDKMFLAPAIEANATACIDMLMKIKEEDFLRK